MSGGPLSNQSLRAGKYTLAGMMNGFPYWVKETQAIWFVRNFWMIGPKAKLGSTTGGLYSVAKADCPSNGLDWLYYDAATKKWTQGGQDAKVLPGKL